MELGSASSRVGKNLHHMTFIPLVSFNQQWNCKPALMCDCQQVLNYPPGVKAIGNVVCHKSLAVVFLSLIFLTKSALVV